MHRRVFLTITALASPIIALAQSKSGRDHELQHAGETLSQGSASLSASRIALEKSSNEDVRRFARFEVAEQEAVIAALATMTEARHSVSQPAQPKLDQKAALEKLQGLQGAEFDRAYIAGQSEGHRRLLDHHERYLAEGRDPLAKSLAVLASAHIKEHRAVLDLIRERLG